VAALEVKFRPLDAGLAEVAGLLDKALPARVEELEQKQTSMARKHREKLSLVAEEVDTLLARVANAESAAERASARAETANGALAALSVQTKGLEVRVVAVEERVKVLDGST
jgi:chromosome segregation ATPase